MNHLAQIAGGSPAFPGNDARKYTTDKEASPPGRSEASMDCSGGSLCFKSLQESYLWLEAGAQPLNESLPTTPH
uniref:Uncharacterized protein n=1 Tax=Salix viminalis TaxID=40686 RepID=A0A6N2KSW0_SALVM